MASGGSNSGTHAPLERLGNIALDILWRSGLWRPILVVEEHVLVDVDAVAVVVSVVSIVYVVAGFLYLRNARILRILGRIMRMGIMGIM